jgi:hypothetical protein
LGDSCTRPESAKKNSAGFSQDKLKTIRSLARSLADAAA